MVSLMMSWRVMEKSSWTEGLWSKGSKLGKPSCSPLFRFSSVSPCLQRDRCSPLPMRCSDLLQVRRGKVGATLLLLYFLQMPGCHVLQCCVLIKLGYLNFRFPICKMEIYIMLIGRLNEVKYKALDEVSVI